MATRLERLTVQQAEKALNNLQHMLRIIAYICEEVDPESGGALVQPIGIGVTTPHWNDPPEPYPNPGDPMTFDMLKWHAKQRLTHAQAYYNLIHNWVDIVDPAVINAACASVGLDATDLQNDYQNYWTYGVQINTALNNATTKANLLVIASSSVGIKANIPALPLFRHPWEWV